MSEDKVSLDEAQIKFAKKTNGEVWDLLGKEKRTAEDDETMLHAAYASMYHWTKAGTVVNWQRGEWLLSRVYTVLGRVEPALHHARRCLDLTEAHPEDMADFDIGYAYEGMARSLALAGKQKEAKDYLDKAKAVVETIADEEDRQWYADDLDGGEWYGIA